MIFLRVRPNANNNGLWEKWSMDGDDNDKISIELIEIEGRSMRWNAF